jgi:hypothetical protein
MVPLLEVTSNKSSVEPMETSPDKLHKTHKRKKSITPENSPKKIKITPPGLTQIISHPLFPKKKVICYSGCNKEEIEEFNKTLLCLGDSQSQSDIDDTTTHMVLGANMRTLKTIVALSRGISLVRKEWIIESKKANCWLKDEEFNVDEWFPGAKHSQRAHDTHPTHLLFSSTTFFIGNNIVFPKKTLQKVLESLGGKVNIDPAGVDIRIEGTLPTGKKHSTIVTESWVFDSLVVWKKLNVKDYLPK